MSQESIAWWNQNAVVSNLIPTPWWYEESMNPNITDGPVPDSLAADLFPTYHTVPMAYLDNAEWTVDSERVVVLAKRNDTTEIMMTASSDYVPHQPEETLLNMGLPILSAITWQRGGMCAVQFGNAEQIETPDAVRFDKKLLLGTSGNGSMSTFAKEVVCVTVCDNTFAAATSEKGTTLRARHTKNSLVRVDDIRKQFQVMNDTVENQIDAITAQVRTEVSDRQIEAFLDSLLPNSVPTADEGRAKTLATNQRESVYDWLNNSFGDYRNSTFGLAQSVDAARRWRWNVRGRTRNEYVIDQTINGKFDAAHMADVKLLDKVLANA